MSDAFYRTINRSQKMMLLYKAEFKRVLEMFTIGSSDDYVGVDNMKPLRDTDDNVVYLYEKLSHSSENNIDFDIDPAFDDRNAEMLFGEDEEEKRFCSDAQEGTTIPCTDEKVKMLYNTALATKDAGSKGILVLDCTLSRVNVDGNKFQKAARLKELYRHEGKDIIVIVYSGQGVSYHFPGQSVGFACNRKLKISDVIEKIDASAIYGLETPIFVFGYSKMRRVISYRSSLRVPTRIVMYLGIVHSVENFIQALGRATFNGKSLLEQNGHSHVTYLMPGHDADVAPAYDSYVKEIHRRRNNGDTLEEAMGGVNGKLPDETNYLRHNNRKTGQRPKRDDIVRNLEYSSDHTQEAYNDLYRDDSSNRTLAKTMANKTLTALKNDAMVRKVEDGEKLSWWKVEHPERTRRIFINRNLVRNDEVMRRFAERKRRRAETRRREELKQAKKHRQDIVKNWLSRKVVYT